MGVVQRLSEALANQIAAGEVVERPASAAKELVENALDAGATRIDVVLEDGGRKRLEVVDDGSGMAREDALLALERHTTSKLKSAEDLFDIHTFGFRGEALPSIASVSRFTLTTRRADDLSGTRLVVEGGRTAAVEDVGCPAGTRIVVEDLFFNVPARLKFLKQRATELGHVSDWLTRLGLANQAASLTLTDGGRQQLRAEATQDPKERIAALLGRELYEALYPVEGRHGEVSVRGHAAGPQRANTTSREIFTFVNGRFVRDRGLLHAISRAYEGVLPIGRSPACVLFIELPPERVDVNVHPQKLEVRFADARGVYDAVARALAHTLSLSPWLARAQPARTYALRPAEEHNPPPVEPLTAQQQRISAALDRLQERRPPPAPVDEPRPFLLSDSVRPPEPVLPPSAPLSDPARVVRPVELPPSLPLPAPRPVALPLPLPQKGADKLSFQSLRYLGQVHRTYLVCEAPDGLVLLDQHAAHERVLYEKYRAERAGEAVRGQPFLVPVTLELSPSDARLVEAALEELADLGFDVEPFGGTTFSLTAAPAELSGSDYGQVVRELSAEVRAFGKGVSAEALEEALLARMACHSAVRAGHPLQPAEAQALLQSLDGTPFQAQCPHGRPVAVRFTSEALVEMFGRTYEGAPKAAGRERLERSH